MLDENNIKKSKIKAIMKQKEIINKVIEAREKKCEGIEKLLAEPAPTSPSQTHSKLKLPIYERSRLRSVSGTRKHIQPSSTVVDKEKEQLISEIYNMIYDDNTVASIKQIKDLKRNIRKLSPRSQLIRKRIVSQRYEGGPTIKDQPFRVEGNSFKVKTV